MKFMADISSDVQLGKACEYEDLVKEIKKLSLADRMVIYSLLPSK